MLEKREVMFVDRVQQVRELVNNILADREVAEHARNDSIHIYGVSMLSVQLALKRGLSPEIAAAAGMLHDLYRLRTGLNENHAHNSEEDARTILRDLGLFTGEEQVIIRKAIFRHSNKRVEHDPYDEVLKDADVLQRYLHNPAEPTSAAWCRLKRVVAELGLPKPERLEEPRSDADQKWAGRRVLADIAEGLARQPLVGNESKGGPDVYPVIRYFPGATRARGFDWCASFVYHCCYQAGLKLPIRYPGVAMRFAAVPAWLAWSKLPGLQFFQPAGEASFRPERGDLVIFDRLVSNVDHDHIGVVLDCRNGVLTTAEGNVKNRSGIFERNAYLNINGYVRIADDYRYDADAMGASHIS